MPSLVNLMNNKMYKNMVEIYFFLFNSKRRETVNVKLFIIPIFKIIYKKCYRNSLNCDMIMAYDREIFNKVGNYW